MDEPVIYSLPANLVQAVVNILNELPARLVRPTLNAIEAECVRQDGEREIASARARELL